MVEKVKITYKGETKNVPKTYVEGLKGYERQKQIKSIFEGKKRPKTSFKSKESSWTKKFSAKYGEQLDNMKGGRSKKNIAKVTGIPFKALDEVYKKGKGAFFSSGSRPGQSSSVPVSPPSPVPNAAYRERVRIMCTESPTTLCPIRSQHSNSYLHMQGKQLLLGTLTRRETQFPIPWT